MSRVDCDTTGHRICACGLAACSYCRPYVRVERVAVVDPHHAILASGITVAVVPCTDECPESHRWRVVW